MKTMNTRVKAAILASAILSVVCAFLANIVWKDDRNLNKTPSGLLLTFLFTSTAIFDIF